MSDQARPAAPRLPPRWFIRTFWACHRALLRVSGGRLGLRRPKPGRYGMLRLHTVGRRSGNPHAVVLAYLEDDANLFTLAMNGWADPTPSWWLNLRERPETTVDLVGGSRRMRARAASGAEHQRLWARYAELDKNLDAFARLRSRPTDLVVLEPVVGDAP
ncbi:nitroreductase family deazaflavin-dependent oxidoreductase [Occultella glacieicola]|uniref:Nitroreductase family deazaflavin-dependent oxidoreductase n=1 Tax=Occultella glacieicola TaxID=2518684 RepID=A0ABY2E3A4_9MICO|nr:nitroreductase/quinone reductase family protein [Occultella glacieicola]TDE93970.1 nitroreductase family deazaflavin-dependent oxidoreductase [Occultella glacieicola]